MLTDKCQIAFEKWFKDQNILVGGGMVRDIDNFYTHRFSMQWGVYLEFFESNRLFIMIDWTILNERGYHIKNFNSNEAGVVSGWFGSDTKEAQTESIKKANEIFNNENT